MEYAATAKLITTDRTVDVISIRKGAWKVQDQWDPQGTFEVSVRDLREIWPNPETLEIIDEFLREGYELVELHSIIMLITGSQEWTQLVLRKWAELY